ncbi:MAG TPA: GIY-YIG nuclease family protein [Flavobacteriales bacterium]|nr:GIY-YIG nuclease family protein [Flavobacteriales bacterium]
MPRRLYWVYMMTNKRHTVLYIGMTNSIERRSGEHRDHIHPKCFTARYNAVILVWYEVHSSVTAAITREKQIKKWNRPWKERLINEMNPAWRDLAEGGLVG